jgi:hypothetical protein
LVVIARLYRGATRFTATLLPRCYPVESPKPLGTPDWFPASGFK